MAKYNSQYSASITAGGFLQEETNSIVPLLLQENADDLIKDEIINNRLLHINAEMSRKRVIAEIIKRFRSVPAAFWKDYLEMDDLNQRVANFYVIMKTYKLVFDVHVNVTIKRWHSMNQTVFQDDVLMELSEIASRDSFVDSWSDATRRKISSTYILMIHKARILDREHKLTVPECTNFEYYISIGEQWFLEACLLEPYQIANIKKRMS